jgi:hypothetical protein
VESGAISLASEGRRRARILGLIIEANERVGKPVILPKTVNRYLSALGGFCTWLRANDFIAEDVMQGMFLDLDRSKRTRVPFTSEQLNLLFKSPLYLKCAGDKREHQNGSVSISVS